MSVNAVIAAAPPPAVTNGPRKRDFAEWLSPMLVKELRQGMRTRAFIGTFIIIQLVMMLNITVGILTASMKNAALDSEQFSLSGVDAFFWMAVAVPLLLIVPMMGQASLSAEIKANTLELIFLTRLTAWRIVVGKWLALVAQSVLSSARCFPTRCFATSSVA
jgi:ABC-type transport system involved in multi-copper enzyme maturation permease subunit